MTFLHRNTPLVDRSSGDDGRRIHLKLEYLQPGGSFKIRGIGLLCQRAASAGATQFVCASGGNAGVAAAYAGRMLGIATTVVVPTTTSLQAMERIRAEGASVIQHGADYAEARDHALTMAVAQSATYVPPFDHPDLWEGHSSLIDESKDQCTFDAVICSVGGGGLLAGLVDGLVRNGIDVPIIAVETAGAASLAASVAAKRLVELDSVNTVATSLAARSVCVGAFERSIAHDVRTAIVSDDQAIRASLAFARSDRALVEPACGAALHVAFGGHPVAADFRTPLVVVCGGVGVDVLTFARWTSERSITA